MKKPASILDGELMARALRLARKGLYNTDPNPAVGCVIANEDEVIAEGWTSPAGGPHAERMALAAAGERARGASAYVSLEPCSHEGRTGPCTRALIEAGIKRVVCAGIDPNPLVAGKGIEQLREAGIPVEVGLLESAAAEINRGFFSRMTRGRPWVRSKIAASLDGRTALASGASKWITSPAARADGHRWRARSSAVLSGIGTVLADDPGLDARDHGIELPVCQPRRVIIDSRLRLPLSSKVLALDGEVIVFTTSDDADALAGVVAAGALVEQVAGGQRCDLLAVLERLGELEINDVWVEAGATLNGALIATGLIDELIIYFAPRLLGDDARGMFALPGIESITDGAGLQIEDVRAVGDDLRIVARPTTVAGPRR